MIDFGLLYLFPITFAIIYLLVKLALQQRIGTEKLFKNKWSNLLYNLSFVAPFEWFVDKREEEERKMTKNIESAGLSNFLDARTLQTLQVALFFIGMLIFSIVMIGIEPILNILLFLVGVDGKIADGDGTDLLMARIITFLICLILPISVNFLISKLKQKRALHFLKDLPLLQMFISLSLRSDATIEEVLFTLTTTETSYQKIFQVAYRMYLRDHEEAFRYLYKEFKGTPIIETLKLLERYSDYARIDTILSIENNQEDVVESTMDAKRKVNQVKNIIATSSFTFPFIALMMLGIAPIIYMVTEALNNAV